ncbi:MAG: helix-turn-helix domain-containing protein [Solirubrobacterales bacterium]
MENGVGNKLLEARTRRSLGLQEVEAATKIRARYLQAIENEDWDQLPGDTYARAFVRTYGSFLGLDGERLAEEQRQARGSARPGERLLRVEPRPRRVVRSRNGRRRGPSVSPRFVAVVVSALVVAALLVVGLSTGGGSNGTGAGAGKGAKKHARARNQQQGKQQTSFAGHTLKLQANGEVWVCLLDAAGKPLVNGQVLLPGETEGPFRSGSFTLALGNGAVTMTVDGQRAKTPEPSSPIGFTVDSKGSIRELPEGERPTCT